MIILITCWDEYTNRLVVSHGVDEETGRNVILPCNPPSYFKATFNHDIGEWVIP